MTMPAAMTMPVDEETLASLVDAARLSTSQLENVAQSILGASITSISNASTPAEQARDMVTYARQYGLLRQVAAAIIYTGADRAGLQNLILGDEHMESGGNYKFESQLVRLLDKLERVVERLNDIEGRLKAIEASTQRLNDIEGRLKAIEASTQRLNDIEGRLKAIEASTHRDASPPLNWNIIILGAVLAMFLGGFMYLAMVRG